MNANTLLHEMARVVSESLTDDSTAYNVHVYPTVDGEHFVIGAIDQKHARAIANALNNGAAWITLP